MNWSRDITSTEILFIACFIGIYVYYYLKISKTSKQIQSTSHSIFLKFILRLFYFSALIIALLGPNFGLSETEARAVGREIFIAFDVSNSMNANDVEPSRIDKSKNELINLIEPFKSDKIGLMVFNSVAEIMSPLTYDFGMIKRNLATIKTSNLPKGSTDFNAIFKLLLSKNKDNNSQLLKIAIIVSDGENFENIDNEIISKLKKTNLKIYFVGVGSTQGGKIPEFGSFKKDKEGQEVETILDIKQIADFARVFNSEYFIINNQTNQMSQLADKINNLKNTDKNSNQVQVTYNKYFYFLIFALILISIDFLITIKIFKI